VLRSSAADDRHAVGDRRLWSAGIFVADEHREPALLVEPGVIEKLLWGGKVRGLRVALRKAKMPMVAGLLKKAWLRKAPGC
jgi:hypothetical protein